MASFPGIYKTNYLVQSSVTLNLMKFVKQQEKHFFVAGLRVKHNSEQHLQELAQHIRKSKLQQTHRAGKGAQDHVPRQLSPGQRCPRKEEVMPNFLVSGGTFPIPSGGATIS